MEIVGNTSCAWGMLMKETAASRVRDTSLDSCTERFRLRIDIFDLHERKRKRRKSVRNELTMQEWWAVSRL